MNYYDILEIPRSSNVKQIKKAYHKLCLQWHPDKNKSNDACEKFKEIAKAYETLSDPILKQTYDNQLPKQTKKTKKSFFFSKFIFKNKTK